MARQKDLESSPHFGKALAGGPDGVSILRGFVGPSERAGYVRLVPSLADTSISVEIAEADIVDTGDVQGNALGKKIVWIRRGSTITVTKTHVTPYGVRPKVAADPELRSIRSGRLLMQVRAEPPDVCASVCSCGTCQSQCTNVCGVCMCVPQKQ